MSAEKISIIKDKPLSTLATPEVKKKDYVTRVDINNLLARVRKQKQKDNFINMVFFGLIVSVLVVFGIILSF